MNTSAAGPTTLVSVRRNAWLSGVVGALAAAIALGYLLRASGAFDTVVGVVLLLVAAVHGSALWSAHMPVLVADEHGIRLRIGTTWRGLPWSAMRQIVVEHADNPLRESRLVVVPRESALSPDELDAFGRLHLRWNSIWYGAALSVPLGMTTLTDSNDLAGDLTGLAEGRTDVVAMRGRRLAQLDEVVAAPVDLPLPPDDEPLAATADAPVVEPEPIVVEPEPVVEVAPEPPAPLAPEPPAPEPVAPVRSLNQPARVEVRLDVPAIAGAMVPEQRQPEDVPDLVHADAWEELPIEVEAEDLSVHGPDEATPHEAELTEPMEPTEPVIGTAIAHARQMLDMSIDELSARTRIRPHVLEAIEVDDFGPCGGDFYARGHLTAIARILGLDLEPLMSAYDERYAGGPINARRVFEAELATGLSGGMRVTRGGPQWSLLIGAVLCLALVWGVARLLAGDPAEVAVPPVSSGDAAGLAANRQPITSPLMKTTAMSVTAAHAGAHVVVKDRTGRILWSGDLRMTHRRKIVGLAPFTVESDNAGAIEVSVAGHAMGTLGTAGETGSKRYQ